MLHQDEKDWLDEKAEDAAAAHHPFPYMAACEAALESGYGKSWLAAHAHNLFGTKQHAKAIYQTIVMPTREFIDGQWVMDGNAAWVFYPDEETCFADRLATLERLAPEYPHYRAALDATDPLTYVREVSKTWSTDPKRADHIIRIYGMFYPDKMGQDIAKAAAPKPVPVAVAEPEHHDA